MKRGQGLKAAIRSMVWAAALAGAAWGEDLVWTKVTVPSPPPNSKAYQTCCDIGIGTSNPYQYTGTRTLTVEAPTGGYGAEIRLQGPNGQWPAQFYSVSWETVLGSAASVPLVFRTNASEKMRIAANGNVGIGTTNPGVYKLAVEGTIAARDVVVTNAAFADYVFQPDYRLLPLSEVSAFIQMHRHLPGIPTEAEVKAKGVSVGEMQAKLLAKVEELTLHLIEQDKENRVLRERLARLEARVAGK